jgi:two-component system, NarL family, response regulator DevR
MSESTSNPKDHPTEPPIRAPVGASEPERVMIIEPQELARRGLRSILEEAPDIQVVAVCADQQEAETLLASVDPHVVIIDSESCDLTDPDLCDRLGHEHIPWVVLSASEAPSMVRRSRAAGAVAYVTKRADGVSLVRAVRLAVTGEPLEEFVVGPSVPDAAEERRWAQARLTPREERIFWMIGEGQSNRQIATMLGLAESTVKNNVCNVLAKLGFDRRTQLIPYAAARSSMLDRWST